MPVYEIDGITPVIDKLAFVHDSAVIIGDVIIEEGVYIGPLASIRGDFGRIIIKKNANIQDNCVLHTFPNLDLMVHEYGHIGHSAILHGCTVGENAMIGMGSIIMDKAIIGKNAIIGANSLVAQNTSIPANHLAFGSPIKVQRELREEEIEWKIKGTEFYIELVKRSLQSLKKTNALPSLSRERDALRCKLDFGLKDEV